MVASPVPINGYSMDFKKMEGGVLSFYSGTSVLVTGATGFVGKALLEKLLRTCESIDTVYVLLRPKRGDGVERRFEDLMKNTIFDTIRKKRPELLDKAVPVRGDVSQPMFGMSAADQRRIFDNVAVVIHSAATVRFVEPLSEALALNTRGAKYMLEMCCKIKHLKSVIHVSTAYSNANRIDVGERVYPTSADPEALLECIATLPREIVDKMWPSVHVITAHPRIHNTGYLTDNHPNTYTFTKSLAENIIARYHGRLPVAIVRPAIISGAYNEPFPGWVDNAFGSNGFVLEVSRGTIRSTYGAKNCAVDLTPVDFAVNTCIAAAWHHTTLRSKEVTVYNCASSPVNPITWDDFMSTVVEESREHPSKYTVFYPNFRFTNSRVANTFWVMFAHLLPNFIFDLILRVQGKKPIMMKIARRANLILETGDFFSSNAWIFSNDNMKRMMHDLKERGEDVYFPFDFTCIDWRKYIQIYVLGIRKYFLKESTDSIPAAKKRLQRLYIQHKFIQVVTGYYLFNLLFGKR